MALVAGVATVIKVTTMFRLLLIFSLNLTLRTTKENEKRGGGHTQPNGLVYQFRIIQVLSNAH
jgi:hypothetical protein